MIIRKKPGVAFWANVALSTTVAMLSAYGVAYIWMMKPTVARSSGDNEELWRDRIWRIEPLTPPFEEQTYLPI